MTDPWRALREATTARIGLGRAGGSLTTDAWLDFRLAHARARDAVHAPLDVDGLTEELERADWRVTHVRSAAPDMATFLRRPDLGRRLAQGEAERLESERVDVALVASGGLSASALHHQLLPLLAELRPELEARGLGTSSVFLVRHGRVAIGDPVARAVGARAVWVLVGERPGLGTPDSLGAYLTYGPREGRSDADRNCISNIHRGGLGHAAAARKMAWLLGEALRRQLSGVELKDEEDGLPSGPTGEFAVSPPSEHG